MFGSPGAPGASLPGSDGQDSDGQDLDAPVLLLGTSGTTGRSKLAVWTQRVMATFIENAAPRGVRQGERVFVNMQMMHASGCWAFASCLLTGATFVVAPHSEPDLALDTVEAHGCTVRCAFPLAYMQCAEVQRVRPRNLESLRLCVTAGDSCSAETSRPWLRLSGARCIPCGRRLKTPPARHPAKRPDPTRRYCRTARCCAWTGSSARCRTVSWVSCGFARPMYRRGYWEGPGTITPFPDRWFVTGDLAAVELDGQVQFFGRKKDLIVRGGSNISPVEVEGVLAAQAGVENAAVVGIPDQLFGQRVGLPLCSPQTQSRQRWTTRWRRRGFRWRTTSCR